MNCHTDLQPLCSTRTIGFRSSNFGVVLIVYEVYNIYIGIVINRYPNVCDYIWLFITRQDF